MDIEELKCKARNQFEFGCPSFPHITRQFPAYALFHVLRVEYAEKFTTLELNDALTQMPIETWNVGSFWDIRPVSWRDEYFCRATVHEEIADCLANAIAYSVAPAYSLAPGTTWDEWKKMHPEKGWL